MKKIVILAMMLIGIVLGSCTSEDDAKSVEGQMGSIYGIVTELGTAEPMKAIGVELYKKDASSSKDALLLKTVTFDDGHFEFLKLKPENYQVKVVADGYEQTEEGYVAVEAGRQARIDLQVKNNAPDYIIIDNLMIQKKDFGPLSWRDADQICKASSVAGYTDWRLPTIDELRIMYYKRSEIPNLKSDKYWSSYVYKPYNTYYIYIDFSTGNEGDYSESWGTCYVRAVRSAK